MRRGKEGNQSFDFQWSKTEETKVKKLGYRHRKKPYTNENRDYKRTLKTSACKSNTGPSNQVLDKKGGSDFNLSRQ